MAMFETVKRSIKNCIPWRLRYFIKLQEGKGYIKIPEVIKQRRSIEEYNKPFYDALEKLEICNFAGKIVCEMGPGEFVSHAFIEYQLGADREILLEIADFADIKSLADRKKMQLKASYSPLKSLSKLDAGESWIECLDKINATYSINGLDGYKEIPDVSVDFVFSFAVLEHIRKKIFVETFKEVFRFMRFGGVAYHTVDFTDHFGGGKNQLRFSDLAWEDDAHYNMYNYTNRIPCTEMCEILTNIGFEIMKIERVFYKKLPISRSGLSLEFNDISQEDLMTQNAVIILKKPSK